MPAGQAFVVDLAKLNPTLPAPDHVPLPRPRTTTPQELHHDAAPSTWRRPHRGRRMFPVALRGAVEGTDDDARCREPSRSSCECSGKCRHGAVLAASAPTRPLGNPRKEKGAHHVAAL